MGTFNSAQAGNWNTDATWTEAGHPVANDDIVIITHEVTYDVGVSGVTWGNCTLNSGGVLIFSISSNSKMLFNATGILTINNGGELRAGTSGSPIAAANLCQIHWPQGAAARYTLALAAGGIINVYGDPAFYGSTIEATLDSNWNAGAGLTLYVEGDYSAKWQAGQYFIIHDYAQYANYQTDAEIFCIDSVGAYDAGNDRTPIVVTAAGDSDTFVIGAGLWMLSRNIELADPGSPWTVYGYGSYTERIRFDNNQAAGNDNIRIEDTLFRGWVEASYLGHNFNVANGSFVNCYRVGYSSHYMDLSNVIIASCYYGLANSNYNKLSGWAVGNKQALYTCYYNVLELDLIGNEHGVYSVLKTELIGDVCSNSTGLYYFDDGYVVGNIKKNGTGVSHSDRTTIVGDVEDNTIGVSTCELIKIIGNLTNNTNGFVGCYHANIVQGGVVNNINNVLSMDSATEIRRAIFSNCTVAGTYDELEIIGNCGDFLCLHNGDGNWQAPNSGSAFILQMTPNVYCLGFGTSGMLKLTDAPNLLSFGYAESGARVLTFKVWPVGWTASLTDAELYLEVYYLAGGAGGALTRVVSGALTMANGAWRNLTVSFTTGQAGIFYYNLILKKYEAGDYVLIDPEWSIS